MQMKRNVGKADRMIRLIGGAALVAAAAFGVIGVWGYIGLIFVATAFMNFCPLYKIVGFKTCSDC